jgi:hypothetical protein
VWDLGRPAAVLRLRKTLDEFRALETREVGRLEGEAPACYQQVEANARPSLCLSGAERLKPARTSSGFSPADARAEYAREM